MDALVRKRPQLQDELELRPYSTGARGSVPPAVRQVRVLADQLPAVYAERFRTQIYNERVAHPGAWNKIVAVAREDDDDAMLNHALIQSRRRYRP